MKKQIAIFGIILILCVFAVYNYMTNSKFQEKIASFVEEDFSEDNIYSDLDSLSARLEQEIMNGSEDFVVYLKDMDVNAIDQINESLDGVFGSGDTYQQMGEVANSYQKVKITIKRNTNYYVWKAYMEGTEIPDTEQKAQQLFQIVRQIMVTYVNEDMTEFEKEVALHDYLVENCEYSRDTSQPPGSDIYRAYGALVNGDAVCNGYAEALQLLFACAGIESQFVVGTADGVEHAWNLVCLDDVWYHLDATWNDPVPDQKDVVIHTYFNVKDDIIAETHTWNQENYPEAFGMDYNYYVYNNLYFRDFNEYKVNAYRYMVEEKRNCFEAVMRSYEENENDMQFVFRDNDLYDSVNWQTYCAEKYCVLVIQAE